MTPSIPRGIISAKKKLLWIGALIIVVCAVGFGVYQYQQLSWEVARLRASPQGVAEAAKADVKKIVSQVSMLIAVPQDETPTIATVSDSEKLKVNPFFASAKNGDKVLIFTGAKKAILYRPDENKIIEVGPLSIGTASATVADKTADKKAPYTFVLYNGTDVTGFTKTYEATLKASVASAVIADRDNAAKRDYEKSLIVDLTGTNSTTVTDLAKMLGLEVSTLPAGEIKPAGADFLIILGEDKM